MENTKPKINVKLFLRSKVDIDDKPIENQLLKRKLKDERKK